MKNYPLFSRNSVLGSLLSGTFIFGDDRVRTNMRLRTDGIAI